MSHAWAGGFCVPAALRRQATSTSAAGHGPFHPASVPGFASGRGADPNPGPTNGAITRGESNERSQNYDHRRPPYIPDHP
jgi:hypothetical protein